MSKCVPCPSKEEKPELPCPAPHPAQHCRRTSRGEGCTPRALAEGLLLSLCAKVLGASPSPYRPRNDKWGPIRSSHRRVLSFEISCQKSALLSLPLSLWSWWGTAGVPQPTGTVFTLVYREVLFIAILTGPQLRQRSRVLAANGLASPRAPSRGANRGRNVALQYLARPAAGSIAHQHLSNDSSFVLVPERGTRQGLHRSFPSALWVTRLFSGRCFAEEERCQLRILSSPFLPTLLWSHSSLRHSLAPVIFFSRPWRGKGFLSRRHGQDAVAERPALARTMLVLGWQLPTAELLSAAWPRGTWSPAQLRCAPRAGECMPALGIWESRLSW